MEKRVNKPNGGFPRTTQLDFKSTNPIYGVEYFQIVFNPLILRNVHRSSMAGEEKWEQPLTQKLQKKTDRKKKKGY